MNHILECRLVHWLDDDALLRDQQRVNKDTNLKVLQTKIIPWMDKMVAIRPNIFQHDSVPSHVAKVVQNFCRRDCALLLRTQDMDLHLLRPRSLCLLLVE